jgi:predicted dehydrogenase
MLRASGVRTFGIDVDAAAAATARAHCADEAWARSEPGVGERIDELTGGLGTDAVIITAGTSSLDPINFAGRLARKKGRVVVVGAVPTGFDRDPHYYRKELDLRMSCSYGPGRYDLDYEEKGFDYPAAYVRWTENRNMQAFQHLVHSGSLDLDYLSTHEFAFEEAAGAYDLIVARTEPFLGIVLKYDTSKTLKREPIALRTPRPTGRVHLAFIGAGSYAQGNLLPNIPDDEKIVRRGVLTNSGTTSKRVAERFSFEFCADQESDILANDTIDTIFIATRHDSHADYVLKALRAGKHVFVEKPLCLREDELEEISTAFADRAAGRNPAHLLVGFNRRFAPLAVDLKKSLGSGPMAMIYRVNAGSIPPDTWIQDPDIGGGRIVGEGCHFIDFLAYLCGSLPVSISAMAVPDPNALNDTVSISVTFANGSIGTVHYFANGSKELPKEYVEVYQAGRTGILRDFKALEIYGSGKPKKQSLVNQDKGQAAMVRRFIEAIRDGAAPSVSFDEIAAVTRATFAAHHSLQSKQTVVL